MTQTTYISPDTNKTYIIKETDEWYNEFDENGQEYRVTCTKFSIYDDTTLRSFCFDESEIPVRVKWFEFPPTYNVSSRFDWTMIETNYYILTEEQYHQFQSDADELGLSIDYFLDEFCIVTGEYVQCD